MSLFSMFKKNAKKYVDASSISSDEKTYYQPDEYYTYIAFEGTMDEHPVVAFDSRKSTSFPSPSGLYVSEILLLEYVAKGDYPKPTSGYPAFWWFEYGIRDVGGALKSLEERGYIILDGNGKYKLEKAGEMELAENAYVPYMHKHPKKTKSWIPDDVAFTVWTVNKLLGGKDVQRWKEIVGKIEEERFGMNVAETDAATVRPTSEEVAEYLKEQRQNIQDAAQTPGDGYKESSIGRDLKKLGKDKEALYHFYISIEKGFDAPALYRDTLILLKRYKLKDEEIKVCKKGIKALPKNNLYRDELRDRLAKLQGEKK